MVGREESKSILGFWLEQWDVLIKFTDIMKTREIPRFCLVVVVVAFVGGVLF